MKRLLTTILILVAGAAIAAAQHTGATPDVSGTWTMSMDTPHGPMEGPLEVQQDGVKLTATYDLGHMGKMHLTGTLDGRKVSFAMDVPGGKMMLTGSFEEGKMSGNTDHGGTWSAARK